MPADRAANSHGASNRPTILVVDEVLSHETLIRHHWKKSRAAEEPGLLRVGLRNKLE